MQDDRVLSPMNTVDHLCRRGHLVTLDIQDRAPARTRGTLPNRLCQYCYLSGRVAKSPIWTSSTKVDQKRSSTMVCGSIPRTRPARLAALPRRAHRTLRLDHRTETAPTVSVKADIDEFAKRTAAWRMISSTCPVASVLAAALTSNAS